MTKERARRILKELQRRNQIPNPIEMAFSNQLAFVNDPAKRKAALCSRRAGKSFATALSLITTCLNHPKSTCLYIALTIGTARRIMERDIFAPILQKYHIPYTPNYQQSYIRFNNGSVIYMLGGDSDKDAWKKFLGQKYRLVVIDEAGSFKTDLRNIVQSISPALIDNDGSLILIGTPENQTHYRGQPALFYAATENLEPGWSVHKWTGADNPNVPWDQMIDAELQRDPNLKETAFFQRYYMGHWVIDDDAKVYKFSTTKNTITERAYSDLTKHKSDLVYVLGIDWGWHDATAFVLRAYSLSEKRLYIIHAYKSPHMTDEAVIDYINNLTQLYPVSKFVCDPASTQLIESIRHRTNIPFESAHKQEKERFIRLMSDDFDLMRIQLVTPTTDALAKEYRELTWLEQPSGKRVENPSQDNHLTDAALYAWRYSKYYLAQAKIKPIPKSPDQLIEEYWDREDELFEQRRQERNNERVTMQDWLSDRDEP